MINCLPTGTNLWFRILKIEMILRVFAYIALKGSSENCVGERPLIARESSIFTFEQVLIGKTVDN